MLFRSPGRDPTGTGADTGATVVQARVLSAMVAGRRLKDLQATSRVVVGGPEGADGVGNVREGGLLAFDQDSLSIEVY